MDTDKLTNEELRMNHDFVTAFEDLRKRHDFREMSDAALREIAEATEIPFTSLRTARHLRNAIAHADSVNREAVAEHNRMLREYARETSDASRLSSRPVERSARQALRIHAWLDDDLEQEMLANGFVSIGGDEIGDLTGVSDPDVVRNELTLSMPERTPRAISLFVGYWRRFLWDTNVGDVVVVPLRDGSVAIGEFVGPYHYVPNAEAHAKHRRAVSWSALIGREELGDDVLKTLSGRHTVQEFKERSAIAQLNSHIS